MKAVDSISEIDACIRQEDMVLIYFGSKTCGVCRDMVPKVEKMLEKYPRIQAIQVEIDNLQELAAHYSVFTIPVISLYVEGKKTLREARIISLLALEEKIARYYELFYASGE